MACVGDRVRASDIVAEASLEGQLHPLDLAQALRVSAGEVADHLEVAVGEAVLEGSILASAGRFKMGSRQVRAPFEGRVEGIAGGVLFLRGAPRMLRLRAYLPGIVDEVYSGRGVAIRASGCLVRGTWGSGSEGEGVLATTVTGPGEALTWGKVTLRHRGAILMAGTIEDPRVVLRAARFGLAGLILGSIHPALQPTCHELALPVVVSEGVGRIPMAEPIFDLLRSYDGFPAVISGTNRDGRSGPEVIVPLPVDSQATSQPVARPLAVGALVRLTRPPHLGVVGQVASPPTALQEVQVRLPDGRTVSVPSSNLELLG